MWARGRVMTWACRIMQVRQCFLVQVHAQTPGYGRAGGSGGGAGAPPRRFVPGPAGAASEAAAAAAAAAAALSLGPSSRRFLEYSSSSLGRVQGPRRSQDGGSSSRVHHGEPKTAAGAATQGPRRSQEGGSSSKGHHGEQRPAAGAVTQEGKGGAYSVLQKRRNLEQRVL